MFSPGDPEGEAEPKKKKTEKGKREKRVLGESGDRNLAI